MTFKGNIRKSGNRVTTGGGRGSGGRGGGIAVGGGIGTLVLIGIVWLLGGDVQDINQILNQQPAIEQGKDQNQGERGLDHCDVSDSANKHADCRVEYTALSLDKVWGVQLPRQIGMEYVPPAVKVFNGSTGSGCGMASAATGPFYCPADQTAYFDVSFFDQLHRFGAKNAPFAQEYIIAHEFGHHLQHMQGTLSKSNYNEPGPDSAAVRLELQADCYAGVWAHFADKGADAFLQPITKQQVADAMLAAAAVGDDNIQRRSGGQVRPDLFTHGSSEQRQQAFFTGYSTGNMKACTL
ncbi:MAG: neutral zinc metallopeptidase [Corynebacterium sp.]|uniref:KPN_02809 family neutral zinc metallopeptidase n=1 Tax=Corynebacterium sp. TaxID=1720 RepID=UPI0026DA94EB|nr:neutral zinc metallopeptidase [Corynebacterium sp.]MDO4760331.1 neutral zinc metallopeptidase [Corynebacterium sp.]